jgi:peptide/nickel transport system permease protein
MFSYLVRRLLLAVVTLFFTSLIIYALIRNMPGSPLALDMSNDPNFKLSDDRRKQLEKLYGLDKPWHIGYYYWVRNVAQGNLGDSVPEKRSVVQAIREKLWPTLLLSCGSLGLAYLSSIPIGLYCTARSGKWDERGISVVLYAMYSLPSYVTALMLLSLTFQYLRDTPFELPLQGMKSPNYDKFSAFGQTIDVLKHLFLPLICLTYGSLAYDTRFIKANMEEAIRQDYIRTARAKGASGLRVLVFHAFRNTLIPFITILGISLPAIVGGAVILESIFNWPGMGQLFYQSISRRDYELIMGLTLMFTVLTLIGQLLADLAYALVDPRITYK